MYIYINGKTKDNHYTSSEWKLLSREKNLSQLKYCLANFSQTNDT